MEQNPPPELPALRPGIRLLETDERSVSILHALVLDHQLMHDGATYWVDSRGHATTTSLARLAPSQRMLDRIQIARGFTAFQHFSLVEDLDAYIDETTSLVVVPVVDYPYRGDNLQRGEPEDMLEGVLTRLDEIAVANDVPVLVTRQKGDELTTPIATLAEERIVCERTRFGPRFSADDFETLVYPVGDGWFQTTIAYWREVLEARIKAAEQLPKEIAYGTN